MLLSEVLWTIHIFSWAAGGQIPWCTMLLSLVWRLYEQNLSEWANGLHRPILRQWHWSGQCEVHRVRVSWPCHSGRSSDAFQRWYKGSSIIVTIFTSVHSVLFFVTPSPPPKSVLWKCWFKMAVGHKPTFEISPRRCMSTFAKFNWWQLKHN